MLVICAAWSIRIRLRVQRGWRERKRTFSEVDLAPTLHVHANCSVVRALKNVYEFPLLQATVFVELDVATITDFQDLVLHLVLFKDESLHRVDAAVSVLCATNWIAFQDRAGNVIKLGHAHELWLAREEMQVNANYIARA